ncbi:hypothetical protein O3P69_004148 [Scylla paramamosain]|uniref:ALF2 n=2 Tax=Scylla TaxID=6760 RepID=A4ZPI9_SCYPA|nr:antilipopolysaccharide factor [Scylla paramamosain]ABP96982.1 antilipopolysaccharide factor [Scylla paramamosain]ADW11095.2 anti-lipopolysaccharide factor [Scylla serrata]AFI43797.1 ALF2 [Scylla paramamosain]
MRTKVMAGLCVALVVMCLYMPQPCEAQYEALVASILGKLSGLWHSDTVDFMGHTCHIRRRPKFRKFKLYHEGKFWCPGWTHLEGNSRTKSRSGSARDAIKDFVYKALQNKLITENNAAAWLKG